MIRLLHVYFPSRVLGLALTEAILTLFALLTAAVIWLGRDAELNLLYENGVLRIVAAAGICMLCMYYYDLYDSMVIGNARDVVLRLIQAFGTACVILGFAYYAFPALRLHRGLLLLGLALTGFILAGTRIAFASVNRSRRLSQRTLLLGSGPLARSLAEQVETRPELGLDLVGYLERPGGGEPGLNGMRRLGEWDELARVADRERVSRVVFSIEAGGSLPVEGLLRLKADGVVVQEVAQAYEALTGCVPVRSLDPIWLLLSDGYRVSKAILLYKRAISIAGSVLGLVISAPLLAVVAIAVWLDSPGPIIFRQERVGKDGKKFIMYKFRSMRHGAENDARPAEANDNRVTRVGRWIRRPRLDELPQLYNIFRGDMCFVGPRPFVPEIEEALASQIPMYRERWAVKPGATGWAQVKKGYCSTLEDNIEKLGFDLFYIKNLSIGLDCLILFQTVKILLLGRGAR